MISNSGSGFFGPASGMTITRFGISSKTLWQWLYVEVDEEYLQVNDVIYSENKFPTIPKGWISTRFVKML
jgi:hypothetical protein